MDFRIELDTRMAETVVLTSRLFAVPKKSPAAGPQAPTDIAVPILDEPSRPARSPYDFGLPEREQICKRTEDFKAHQNFFDGSEHYFSKMMKQVRQAAEGQSPPDNSFF